jgi:hypothetical protein
MLRYGPRNNQWERIIPCNRHALRQNQRAISLPPSNLADAFEKAIAFRSRRPAMAEALASA